MKSIAERAQRNLNAAGAANLQKAPVATPDRVALELGDFAEGASGVVFVDAMKQASPWSASGSLALDRLGNVTELVHGQVAESTVYAPGTRYPAGDYTLLYSGTATWGIVGGTIVAQSAGRAIVRASASASLNWTSSPPLTTSLAYISRGGNTTATATTVRIPRSTKPKNRGSCMTNQTRERIAKFPTPCTFRSYSPAASPTVAFRLGAARDATARFSEPTYRALVLSCICQLDRSLH